MEKPNQVKDSAISHDLHTVYLKVTFKCLLLLLSQPLLGPNSLRSKTTNRRFVINGSIYGKPDVTCLLSKEKKNLFFRHEIQTFKNPSD